MPQTCKLRLASLLTYLTHFLVGLILFLVIFITAFTTEPSPEGWDWVGLALLTLFSLLVAIYTVILLLPLLFSFLSFRKDKRGFTIACIPFDTLYILAHLIYLITLVAGGESAALVLVPTLALSCATLILNILALKNKTAPQRAEATMEGELQ